jgi:VanZ family protein
MILAAAFSPQKRLQLATARTIPAQNKIKNNIFIEGLFCAKCEANLQTQTHSYCSICRIRFSFAVPKLRAFLKYWLPVLIWMAVIFAASSDAQSFEHSSRILAPLLRWLFPKISGDTVHLVVFLARKCAHFVEYGMFALLVWRALNQSKNKLTPWSWPKVSGTLLIVFLYASSDEFHQIFVPTRTPAIHDVVIDTLGGAAALLVFWLVGRWRKRW